MSKVLDARNTHADHRVREIGVVGSYDEIANPRQHQTACNTRALNRRNRGLGNVTPTTTHAQISLSLADIKELTTGLIGVVIPAGHTLLTQMYVTPGRANIVACREVLPLTAKYDDLHVIIGHGPHKSRVQLIGHPTILRIVVLGSIHRDPSNPVSRLVSDDIGFFDVIGCRVAHLLLLSPLLGGASNAGRVVFQLLGSEIQWI